MMFMTYRDCSVWTSAGLKDDHPESLIMYRQDLPTKCKVIDVENRELGIGLRTVGFFVSAPIYYGIVFLLWRTQSKDAKN